MSTISPRAGADAPRRDEPVAPLDTPDPIVTTESITALITGLAGAIVVLFKLDMSDAQRGALTAALAAVVTLAVLGHAAYVRGQRAKAFGASGRKP